MNLIENNKRDVGCSLLQRIAQAIAMDLDDLTGEAEQKLLQDLEEAYADPWSSRCPSSRTNADSWWHSTRTARLPWHAAPGLCGRRGERGCLWPTGCGRTRLLSQVLHQMLSGITAVRSSAEIWRRSPISMTRSGGAS